MGTAAEAAGGLTNLAPVTRNGAAIRYPTARRRVIPSCGSAASLLLAHARHDQPSLEHPVPLGTNLPSATNGYTPVAGFGA